MSRVLAIAKLMKADVVILGAFGCGVFENPPKLVAQAMYSTIKEHKYDFETIELAVYCSPRDTENYDAFLNEFKFETQHKRR